MAYQYGRRPWQYAYALGGDIDSARAAFWEQHPKADGWGITAVTREPSGALWRAFGGRLHPGYA